MVRRARDSVAPMQQSSGCWMPTRVGRLSAGVGRRHPVANHKASLIPGRSGGYEHCGTKQANSSLRLNAPRLGWLFAELLLQYPSQSQQAASGARRMMSASCEVTQGVGDTWATYTVSNVTPRYLGSEQKGRVSWLYLNLSSRLASLLLRWKAADTVFVVLSFSFQVWRYSPSVAMSLVSTPSTARQSPSACMIARSSAYAYFLETVVGRSER